MTEEEERVVVALLHRHQPMGDDIRGCLCGWLDQDGFDIAAHQARQIRNFLGHEPGSIVS